MRARNADPHQEGPQPPHRAQALFTSMRRPARSRTRGRATVLAEYSSTPIGSSPCWTNTTGLRPDQRVHYLYGTVGRIEGPTACPSVMDAAGIFLRIELPRRPASTVLRSPAAASDATFSLPPRLRGPPSTLDVTSSTIRSSPDHQLPWGPPPPSTPVDGPQHVLLEFTAHQCGNVPPPVSSPSNWPKTRRVHVLAVAPAPRHCQRAADMDWTTRIQPYWDPLAV